MKQLWIQKVILIPRHMSLLLEIAAFSAESAIIAQQAGADRIELCDNPAEGGTTPSYGTLCYARAQLSIPLFPIIRPRGGDFLYSDASFEIMKKEVTLCKEIGCDGIVIGLLDKDGNIDVERCAILIELAYPMEITFHRAFDRVRDPFKSLEELIELGVQRILSSGQYPTAPEGAQTLGKLVQQADQRIIIMPGSGVRDNNLEQLIKDTGALEYHTAARITIDSAMEFTHPNMGADTASVGVDAAMIKRMRRILDTQD